MSKPRRLNTSAGSQGWNSMVYQIGTDEAGYGPNLGPLTVTGTFWKTPGQDCDLFTLLKEAVCRPSDKLRKEKLIIGDSKSLYSSTGSVELLERSVLAVCHFLTDEIPRDWQSLIGVLCNGDTEANDRNGTDATPDDRSLESQVWLSGRKLELPVAADVDEILNLSARLSSCFEKTGVDLTGVNCRAIFPAAFNHGVIDLGNKASLLSSVTLEIVNGFVEENVRCESGSENLVQITCDKHGGRSKYAALLQEYLTQSFVTIEKEALLESRYRWKEDATQFEARFIAKGESELTVALSSMVSKYVREVFMMLWNDFWQLKIPGIRPTKGYPVDAKRFKREIAVVQKELGINDHDIWRNR